MPPVKDTVSRTERQQPKQTAPRRTTDAETARRRALAEQKRMKLEKQRRAERKRKASYYGAILLLAVIGFGLFVVIFFGALTIDFNKKTKSPLFTLTETVSDGPDGDTSTHDRGIEERDGVAFVSLGEMAKSLGASCRGDVSRRTLAFADGKTVAFYVGTPYALVDGQTITLPAASYTVRSGEDVRVPYAFFPRFVTGVEFTEEHRGGRIAYGMCVTDAVSLNLSSNEPLSRPMSGGSGEAGAYLTDVSKYEMYIEPEDADAYLTLVNHTHPAAPNVPNDLVNVADTRYDRDPVRLRRCAAMALEALFLELRANGYDTVSVTSGFVSYDEQAALYARTLAEYLNDHDDAEARRRTRERVAEAGCGENMLGLSVDMHNLPSASQAFEAQAAYKWLYANCAEFGFVLRYPKNKSEITGFAFEPYHFRFVGRTHARRMMNEGLCLEEYIESLNAEPVIE